MGHRKRLGIALALASVASLLLTPVGTAPAQAATCANVALFQFTGYVRDAHGEGLQTATVSDGTTETITDSRGYYTLPLKCNGDFNLTAVRGDTEVARKTASITAPGPTSQDFTLFYQSTITLSPSAVNTATGPATMVVEVSTKATDGPDGFGRCAIVRDHRANQTYSVQPQSSSPSGMTFRQEIHVPAGTAMGSYGATAHVETCFGGTVMTAPKSKTYRVDNTAPVVTGVTPESGANTMYSAQPITVYATDTNGSGITRVEVSILDTVTGTTNTLVTTAESAPGRFKTGSAPMTTGRLYRVSVRAIDAAGNRTDWSQPASGGFRAVSLVTPPAAAAIAPTTCTLSVPDLATQMRTATCENVHLDLAAGEVSLSGSLHGHDRGFVDHTVTLAAAKVTTTVGAGNLGSQSRDARIATDAAWNPRTTSVPFEVGSVSSLPATIPTPAKRLSLGTLVTKVPADWTNATLSMGATSTPVVGGACAVPGSPSPTSPVACTPDPLRNRYMATVKVGATPVSAVADRLAAQSGAIVLRTSDGTSRWLDAEIPFSALSKVTADVDIEGIRRLPSLDGTVGSEMALRQALHFQADEPYVAGLLRAPYSSKVVRGEGTFTAAESAELDVRQALSEDMAVIDAYVADRGLEAQFGGRFLDNATGQEVALFTADVDQRRAELLALVPHPTRLDVRPATWSIAELDRQADEVIGDPGLVEQGIRIGASSVDVQRNRVNIVKCLDSLQSHEAVSQAFPAVEKSDGTRECGVDNPPKPEGDPDEVTAGPRSDPKSPPYFGGHGIMREATTDVAGNAVSGGGCTIGFAVESFENPHADFLMTAGHCVPRNDLGDSKAYEWWHQRGAARFLVGPVVHREYRRAMDAATINVGPKSSNLAVARVFSDFYPATTSVVATDEGREQVGYIRCGYSSRLDRTTCRKLTATNIGWDDNNPVQGVVEHRNYRGVGRLEDPRGDMIRGDSGGPWWHPKDGKAYAAGIHWGDKDVCSQYSPEAGRTVPYVCELYTRLANNLMGRYYLKTAP
jgi:hypothetical protein